MTKPIIKYYANGNKNIEQYVVNGELHRDPLVGPAYIHYHGNGNVKLEEYIVNGKLHRDPVIGPALIEYYDNEEIRNIRYYVNGKFHNPYGPAFINHEIDFYNWYLNDINCTNEVNQYLNANNLNYTTMRQTDFNIMWMNIL